MEGRSIQTCSCKPQALETIQHGGVAASAGADLQIVLFQVLGSACYCHRPCRLQNGALVIEDGLDGSTDGLVVHQEHPVQQLSAESEGFCTDLHTTHYSFQAPQPY